jgi:hypothetical protein
MTMDANVLAEVSLEVADYYPDLDNDFPRAEWRWKIIEKAITIISDCNITRDTEDIDELVVNYLSTEEALS